jgi:hypothetical protein
VASRQSTVRDMCIRISAFRMQAGVGSLLEKYWLRQGRLSEAAAILQESIGLIEARNMRDLWTAEPLNAFAELCLIKADSLAGAPWYQAIRAASQACAKARHCFAAVGAAAEQADVEQEANALGEGDGSA